MATPRPCSPLGTLFTGSVGWILISDEYAFDLCLKIRLYAGYEHQPMITMICKAAQLMVQDAGFSERVMIVGGHNGGNLARVNQLPTTRKLQICDNELLLEDCADAMHCGCVAGSVAILNEGPESTHMYLLGGYDGTVRLSALQEYDIACDTWRTASDVGHPVWGSSLVAHDQTRTLWSLGGYDGTDILRDTSVYSIDDDEWFDGPDLYTAINSGTAALLGEKTMYRAGGQAEDFE